MPVRINRVYTRAGDDGADRARRRAPRAQGLAAHRGLRHHRRAELDRRPRAGLQRAPKLKRGKNYRRLDEILRRIQNELFDLGSELATPREAFYEGMFRVGAFEVTALEKLMDECQKDLAPLKSFVLPGGGPVGGFLHQARTVCRRAERGVLALSRVEDIGEWPLKYVNRLSDLFFVLSRWVGKHLGETEYLWERGLASHARKR